MMKTYCWSTEDQHFDNSHTMNDWISCEMPEYLEVVMVDGTYAEVQDLNGTIYAVNASGDGDSFNHKVEFEEIG